MTEEEKKESKRISAKKWRDNNKEVYKLNHYTNLRPLCSYTNRHIKKDKLNYEIV